MQLRGVLREVGSAGPNLALGLTCLVALFHPEVEARFGPRIGVTLGVEFVALHGFAFLGRIALARPERRSLQVLRIPAFIALGVIYTLFIYGWGIDAVISFWMVTFFTYAGFFFHDAPEQRVRTLTCRWAVALALFFAVAVVCGLTAEYFNLRSPRKEFLFGFMFFTALGIGDLVHLYDRLLLRFFGSAAPRPA